MSFPTLSPCQFAVALAEVATGIVLTTDGQNWHTGSGEKYRVFSFFEAARTFAREVVSSRAQIECWIYDSPQKHLERLTAQS